MCLPVYSLFTAAMSHGMQRGVESVKVVRAIMRYAYYGKPLTLQPVTSKPLNRSEIISHNSIEITECNEHEFIGPAVAPPTCVKYNVVVTDFNFS